MILKIFLSLFITLIFFRLTAQDDENWLLEKNESGIKVYTRKSEGESIKEFKAVTTLTASISQIEKILDDVENYPKWQSNVSSAKILNIINENIKIIYYTSDLPWPADDRDIVVRTEKIKLKNGGIKYNLSSATEQFPVTKSYIRIVKAFGFWKFWPTDDGKTKIIYQFLGDPAGNLPESIINMFIVGSPFDNLKYLKSL